MCGILGIFERAPSAADLRALLPPGLEALKQRGPDGRGMWLDASGAVALGHTRLAIIDLSENGAQPMVSADGQLAVTFDGKIFNYRELQAELRARGVQLRSDSDTEVLLHLYAAYGASMVSKLRGMFAFGLWDAARGALLLARDPYGIKPLYYSNEGPSFRFASQVRALLATGVSRAIDDAALAGYYLLGSVPEPRTIVRAVRALPPGTTLTVTRERVEEPKSVFSIARAYANAQPLSVVSESAVRAALLDSVKHHLVADVPVGLFLSAGIDSGALLGLMRDAAGDAAELEAVTLVFEENVGTMDDEGPLAKDVAARYRARHTLRRVARAELEADLPAFFAAMDQPSIDGINSWLVSKAAAELGLKVAISGLGGDELLGGYPSFTDVPRWVRLFAPTRYVPKALGVTRALLSPVLMRAGISSKAQILLAHGSAFEGAYLARRGLFTPWELPALMGPHAAERGLAELQPLEHVRAQIADLKQSTPFARVATLEATLYLRNQLLRDTDWASMAHSLEVRLPLVDSTLLETLAPSTVGGRATKQLLARAPSKRLPDSVAFRPKTGFTTPVGKWLRESPLLQAWRALPELADDRTHWARRYAYCVARTYTEQLA